MALMQTTIYNRLNFGPEVTQAYVLYGPVRSVLPRRYDLIKVELRLCSDKEIRINRHHSAGT